MANHSPKRDNYVQKKTFAEAMGDAEPAMPAGDAELTVEAIEKMKKADLVAAHIGLGADPAQTEAKTVAILREELIAAVTANE